MRYRATCATYEMSLSVRSEVDFGASNLLRLARYLSLVVCAYAQLISNTANSVLRASEPIFPAMNREKVSFSNSKGETFLLALSWNSVSWCYEMDDIYANVPQRAFCLRPRPAAVPGVSIHSVIVYMCTYGALCNQYLRIVSWLAGKQVLPVLGAVDGDVHLPVIFMYHQPRAGHRERTIRHTAEVIDELDSDLLVPAEPFAGILPALPVPDVAQGGCVVLSDLREVRVVPLIPDVSRRPGHNPHDRLPLAREPIAPLPERILVARIWTLWHRLGPLLDLPGARGVHLDVAEHSELVQVHAGPPEAEHDELVHCREGVVQREAGDAVHTLEAD